MEVEARAFQDVRAAVAEPSGRRARERRGVEPVVERPLGRRKVAVGEAVGQAPYVFVFEGSAPEKDGEKNCPLSM